MKELSVEEKAKRYDEAIGKANDILKGYNPKEGSKATINYIFPELKESEDERIRKRIIQAIKIREKEMNEEWSDEIAWIEKQGQSHWSEEDRTMAFTLMRDVDQISYISKEGKNERIGWLNSLDEKFASTESTWSEEDEKRFKSCLNILQVQAKGFMGITETINTKWLKSLKNRIKGE